MFKVETMIIADRHDSHFEGEMAKCGNIRDFNATVVNMGSACKSSHVSAKLLAILSVVKVSLKRMFEIRG